MMFVAHALNEEVNFIEMQFLSFHLQHNLNDEQKV